MLREGRSLRGIAETTGTHREIIRRRFHNSLDALTARSSLSPLDHLPRTGNLIVITDAIFATCEGKDVMIACVYLRPVLRNTAVLAAIVAFHGDESEENWQRVFAKLPVPLHHRIVALVSDDSLGLARYARGYGWIHQRCHFHLKMRLWVILGRRKRIRFKRERERAWELCHKVIAEPDARRIGWMLRELRALGKRKTLPRLLRLRVNGFLRSWRGYRMYLVHPELRLPATSNVAEAGGSLGRDMLRKRRGFKTMKSLKRWLTTIKILHPTMTCKRANHLPN